jgi:branched-chain amino acid transport system substrate-binding protein
VPARRRNCHGAAHCLHYRTGATGRPRRKPSDLRESTSARVDGGKETVRFGFDDPLTGTYAAVGKNELIGCQLAIEQINAKGGILGRQAQLLIEDSPSGDAATAVQKARKLIERDRVNFLLGNVNSALSLDMAQVAHDAGVLLMVTGGHTDAVTGSSCHWNVFRVCNTTQMEANAVTPALIKNAGKKWYYITPDYAFGHTLQSGWKRRAGCGSFHNTLETGCLERIHAALPR